eukprot:SAG31_NODE_3823_length_3849_cov_2.562133_2_plen_202_part_00
MYPTQQQDGFQCWYVSTERLDHTSLHLCTVVREKREERRVLSAVSWLSILDLCRIFTAGMIHGFQPMIRTAANGEQSQGAMVLATDTRGQRTQRKWMDGHNLTMVGTTHLWTPYLGVLQHVLGARNRQTLHCGQFGTTSPSLPPTLRGDTGQQKLPRRQIYTALLQLSAVVRSLWHDAVGEVDMSGMLRFDSSSMDEAACI